MPNNSRLSYDPFSGDVTDSDGQVVAHLRVCRLTGYALLYPHSRHWLRIYAADTPIAALPGGAGSTDTDLERFAIAHASGAVWNPAPVRVRQASASTPNTRDVAALREDNALLLNALRSIYTSALDQRSGYGDRELHEPWPQTQRRAYTALVRVDPALANELAPPDVETRQLHERARA